MSSRLTIFICEFITAGGMGDAPLGKSLMREGVMMRDAVLNDLCALDQYNLVTMHDARIASTPTALAVEVVTVQVGEFNATFASLVASADLVWIIAPETDGILLDLMQIVENHGVAQVGCGLQTVKVASSKLLTANYLAVQGIAAVKTINGQAWQSALKHIAQTTQQWLAKPIDGVGCEGIHLFSSAKAVTPWLQIDNRRERYCLQPFHSGISASISMLCKAGEAWLLSANQQVVEMRQETLVLTGLTVNGLQQYWPNLSALANKIASAMPAATGYLGVDVMIDPQHGKIEVLEINPRLTTSYVALSEATGVNISALILDCHLSPSFTMPTIERNVVSLTIN